MARGLKPIGPLVKRITASATASSNHTKIEEIGLRQCYLERRLRAMLPRALLVKLKHTEWTMINGEHEVLKLVFDTGQDALIPTAKIRDPLTITELCVLIR